VIHALTLSYVAGGLAAHFLAESSIRMARNILPLLVR
jgi:hypothetical protein